MTSEFDDRRIVGGPSAGDVRRGCLLHSGRVGRHAAEPNASQPAAPGRTYLNKLTRSQPTAAVGRSSRVRRAGTRNGALRSAGTGGRRRGADLHVRAWRFSYNARGIIEMPNRLIGQDGASSWCIPGASTTARAGARPSPPAPPTFAPIEKNHLAGRHTREVIDPFLKSLRGKVSLVMYSLPGSEDPIRHKLYRSFTHRPDDSRAQRRRTRVGRQAERFRLFAASRCPSRVTLSSEQAGGRLFSPVPRLGSPVPASTTPASGICRFR